MCQKIILNMKQYYNIKIVTAVTDLVLREECRLRELVREY